MTEALACFPTEWLVREINRRRVARAQKLCDYCGRPFDSEPPCPGADRHYALGMPNKSEDG
jgi:hypothetical protein